MGNQKSAIDKVREDSTESAEARREIAALATIGLIDFGLISLLQLGYFRRLPDLPGRVFDTVKVNTSKDAVLLGMPDGVVSLAGYTATIGLATAATRFRKPSRVLDLAMGAVLLGQAAGAAQYLVNMTAVQKRICIYCVTGAVINFAALKPLRRLFKRRS